VYALEGSCFIAGAAVQWLRGWFGIIGSGGTIIETLVALGAFGARVCVCPTLSVMGRPIGDQSARLITGIHRGTTRAHLARARSKPFAFQVNDVTVAMSEDTSPDRAHARETAAPRLMIYVLQAHKAISAL